MWLFVLLLMLFYLWPLFISIGFILAWKQTKRPALLRLFKIALVFEIFWIIGVAMMARYS